MNNQNFKIYTNIVTIFAVTLVLSNILSSKLTTIWPLTFDWGTILFPLSYIFWDILTEVYWFKKARKAIYLWLFSCIFASFFIFLVWALPSASDWWFQESYQNILLTTPRIFLASIIAYFIWEFVNSYILAKIKVLMAWKYLFVRTIWSTIFWQLFDTIIFTLIAFYWVFPNDVLIAIILSNYVLKVWIEVLFTPITYLIVWKLKKVEKVDYYDKNTNFNPFSMN